MYCLWSSGTEQGQHAGTTPRTRTSVQRDKIKWIYTWFLLKSLLNWLLNFCKSEGKKQHRYVRKSPHQKRSWNNLNLCTLSFRCFSGLFQLGLDHNCVEKDQAQFFLMQSPSDKTHKPSEELSLLQAVLGRRTVNISEDSNHKEVWELIWHWIKSNGVKI